MDYIDKVVAGVITLLVTGFVAMVRTVFTNKTQIAILRTEIKDRAKDRAEKDEHFRKALESIHQDINGLKDQILDIWKAK